MEPRTFNGAHLRTTRKAGVTFAGLAAHQCRFDISGKSSPHEYMFCGAERAVGPYCAHHKAIAYSERMFNPQLMPFTFAGKR